MRNKELCKKLLEVILQVKIAEIVYPEEQKTIDLTQDAKSVRLDVYVEDAEHTIYNIEMQATDTKNLPKRSRYYQSMIDLNLIEKGDSYNKLKKSYVIFICKNDLFGKNRSIYTFENICKEDPSIVLGDETTKIFLNAGGSGNDIPSDLRNFLTYLQEGTVIDGFTTILESEVKKAQNNEEWRREFMTLQMKEREKFEEGREEGREEGQLIIIAQLLNQRKITIEDAARMLNITVDVLKAKLNQ